MFTPPPSTRRMGEAQRNPSLCFSYPRPTASNTASSDSIDRLRSAPPILRSSRRLTFLGLRKSRKRVFSKSIAVGFILSMLLARPAESFGQAPPLSDAQEFQLAYATSGNFDYCGQREIGQKFRELLEKMYNVCYSSNEKQNIDLPFLKGLIRQLDSDIDHHNLAPIKAGDLEDCKTFLSRPSEKSLANKIRNQSSEEFLHSLPKDCDDY